MRERPIVERVSTRDRAIRAAVELLGTEGAHALTHRRVDDRAGLPAGSTSNHFRTRAALVDGAADGIVGPELRGLEAAVHPTDAAELVEQLAALVEQLTGPMRVATTARHVLFLEATHDAHVRERLSADRPAYVAGVAAVLERLGAAEPRVAAEALAATCEGIILHRIARGDASDPRPVLAVAVRGALG